MIGRIRKAAGLSEEGGPGFDRAVGPDGGYAWWYVDAISDDGIHGLTMIAFIGSVFSPYYAWSGWRDPAQHCAINVALYRMDAKPGGRWAMTERGARGLIRDARSFQVGPSRLDWDGTALTASIHEITAPIPSRLKGVIRVVPEVRTETEVLLDPAGRHVWRPLAPRARVELTFNAPALHWAGDGYFDANHGDEPLERGFVRWHWGRAHRADDVALFYDVDLRGGGHDAFALSVDGNGAVSLAPAVPVAGLPRGFWGVSRQGWSDPGHAPRIHRTLEDAPFYLRSAVRARLGGADALMMHESLDLDRLRNPVVRAMLPFRMPRAGR
jgi:carotenoid 1,2-hydratase